MTCTRTVIRIGSFKFTSLWDKCRNVLPTQQIDSTNVLLNDNGGEIVHLEDPNLHGIRNTCVEVLETRIKVLGKKTAKPKMIYPQPPW